MAGNIIDGKKIANEVKEELRLKISDFRSLYNITPGLAVILWGDDSASRIYVRNKVKACDEIGILSQVHEFSKCAHKNDIIHSINALNHDPATHGILVQLPVAEKEHESELIAALDPMKDVDGLHPVNAGKLLQGQNTILPCTPHGIIWLLEKQGISLSGKRAVIIGRSNIVGKPLAIMMLQKDATVTVCHSKSTDIANLTKQADILVSAVGKPKFITADMVKSNSVVIDVGINRVEGKVVGDVDFANVKDIADWITPVPGGVGPMTIAMLLMNTLKAAEYQMEICKK